MCRYMAGGLLHAFLHISMRSGLLAGVYLLAVVICTILHCLYMFFFEDCTFCLLIDCNTLCFRTLIVVEEYSKVGDIDDIWRFWSYVMLS